MICTRCGKTITEYQAFNEKCLKATGNQWSHSVKQSDLKDDTPKEEI